MGLVINSREFGGTGNPTIYYFTGYGSSIEQMKLHIRALTLFGYRVVAFEYEKKILNSGDPKYLVEAIDRIKQTVKADQVHNNAAGIYGMSLGSHIGFELLRQLHIDRAIFNTGGVSVLRAIWDGKLDGEVRRAFENNGQTRQSNLEAWKTIEHFGDLNKDKKVLLMVSDGDELLESEWAIQNFYKWQKSGAKAELIVTPKLSHGHAIFRNLFRHIRTVKFYK